VNADSSPQLPCMLTAAASQPVTLNNSNKQST